MHTCCRSIKTKHSSTPADAVLVANSRSDWFLALIERLPTPGSTNSIGREAFTEQAWPLIGRKVY